MPMFNTDITIVDPNLRVSVNNYHNGRLVQTSEVPLSQSGMFSFGNVFVPQPSSGRMPAATSTPGIQAMRTDALRQFTQAISRFEQDLDALDRATNVTPAISFPALQRQRIVAGIHSLLQRMSTFTSRFGPSPDLHGNVSWQHRGDSTEMYQPIHMANRDLQRFTEAMLRFEYVIDVVADLLNAAGHIPAPRRQAIQATVNDVVMRVSNHLAYFNSMDVYVPPAAPTSADALREFPRAISRFKRVLYAVERATAATPPIRISVAQREQVVAGAASLVQRMLTFNDRFGPGASHDRNALWQARGNDAQTYQSTTIDRANDDLRRFTEAMLRFEREIDAVALTLADSGPMPAPLHEEIIGDVNDMVARMSDLLEDFTDDNEADTDEEWVDTDDESDPVVSADNIVINGGNFVRTVMHGNESDPVVSADNIVINDGNFIQTVMHGSYNQWIVQ